MPSAGTGGRTIAYLTVERDDQRRFWGGLLVIDRVGRPVEFHATAPVGPSRAHEVLYGPTLVSHVCGELMAPALIRALRAAPLLALTDCPHVLAARPQTPFPLLGIGDRLGDPDRHDGEPRGEEGQGMASMATAAEMWADCLAGPRLADHRLWAHRDFAEDFERARRTWPSFAGHVDFVEPLGRIRDALAEARKAA